MFTVDITRTRFASAATKRLLLEMQFPKIVPDTRHVFIGRYLIVRLIIESSDIACPLTYVDARRRERSDVQNSAEIMSGFYQRQR